MRDTNRGAAAQVNAAECALLEQRWVSDECVGALTKFMMRKA